MFPTRTHTPRFSLNYNKIAFTIIPNYAWYKTPPLIQEKVDKKRIWSWNEGIMTMHHSMTNNQIALCPTNNAPHDPLVSNTSCFQAQSLVQAVSAKAKTVNNE